MTTIMPKSGDEPTSKLNRTPADGPNYSPDWRALQVEEYLCQLRSKPSACTIEQILESEPDEFVRDFLLFHENQPCERSDAIAYAVKWDKKNVDFRARVLLRTMILTGASAEKIAAERATAAENITAFEKLYFDVRPYLACGAVVDAIRAAAVGLEKRWFAIALSDGWAGVEQGVLRRSKPRGGERNLQVGLRVLMDRVEDGILDLEGSGIEPNEFDLQRLAAIADIQAIGLPELWLEAADASREESIPCHPTFAKLNAGGRERLAAFMRLLVDGAIARAAEWESTKTRPVVDPQGDGTATVAEGETTNPHPVVDAQGCWTATVPELESTKTDLVVNPQADATAIVAEGETTNPHPAVDAQGCWTATVPELESTKADLVVNPQGDGSAIVAESEATKTDPAVNPQGDGTDVSGAGAADVS